MRKSEKLVEQFSATCAALGRNKKKVAESLYNRNTKKVKVRKLSFINQALGLTKLSFDVGCILRDYTKDKDKNKDNENTEKHKEVQRS